MEYWNDGKNGIMEEWNVGILRKSGIKDGRFLMFVLIIPLFPYFDPQRRGR
jgi:hypothetical protein